MMNLRLIANIHIQFVEYYMYVICHIASPYNVFLKGTSLPNHAPSLDV